MLSFEAFLQTKSRNEWVRVSPHGTLTLYIRKTPNEPRWIKLYGHLQIANMLNENPGHGELKKFLSNQEPHFDFFIENILNERLIRFFESRGYKVKPNSLMDMCPSYLYSRE